LYNDVDGTYPLFSSNYKNANNPTEDDSFGNICVYDGHNVHVGRVVVDSTFHHFVNINLIGVKDASYIPGDDSKKVGFNYSTTGKDYYEKIKTYYCNIALYLTSEDILQLSFQKIIWKAKFDSQLKMLTPTANRLSIRNYRHWIFYGKSVYEVLLRQLTPCMVLHITIKAIDPLALLCPYYFLKIHLPDPPPDYLIEIDRGEFLFITLAVIMITLKEQTTRFNESDYGKFKENMHKLVIESRNQALKLLGGLQAEKHQRTIQYMEFAEKQYLGKQNVV